MHSDPHRRYNPLRQEWVLVSPNRSDRPWHGQVEAPPRMTAVSHDPTCYLCPGNTRAHGVRNPEYASTFVFENDFPALRPDPGVPHASDSELMREEGERGICKVICFSPRHDLMLAGMDPAVVRAVVDAWVDECAAAAAHDWVRYALLFENRGEMMGASSPHPHCQLWATEHVPSEPARERRAFDGYFADNHGACLLCHYLERELELGERLVCENGSFVALVPFWAVWPFETIVVSRRHLGSIAALDLSERTALAEMLRRLTSQYDALFDAPFPYSMGFHQAPVNDGATESWHLHAHFYPPLLRSATVRKFIVGFELLGEPQRDLTPEAAAARLREVSR